jgi:hypothetical protein
MGVSTFGFVCIDKFDLNVIFPRMERAFEKLSKAVDKQVDTLDISGSISMSPCLYINFYIGNYNRRGTVQEDGVEHRNLQLYFGSCHEYSYVGDKLIFSVSNWGSSEEIITCILDEMADLGDCFYCPNDSLDDGYWYSKLQNLPPIEEAILSYLLECQEEVITDENGKLVSFDEFATEVEYLFGEKSDEISKMPDFIAHLDIEIYTDLLRAMINEGSNSKNINYHLLYSRAKDSITS